MDKSKKRLITLLVILGYLVFVYFPLFPHPSSPYESIATETFKLILLIASIIIIVNVWRKKRVKNKNNI